MKIQRIETIMRMVRDPWTVAGALGLASVILLTTGVMKVYGVTTGAISSETRDVIFFWIPSSTLALCVGAVEIVVAAAILFGWMSRSFATLCLFWVSASFVCYRVFANLAGESTCNCLGNLAWLSEGLARHGNLVSLVALGGLLISTSVLLMQLQEAPPATIRKAREGRE